MIICVHTPPEAINSENSPSLYLIVPCYNEEAALPYSSRLFIEKLKKLIRQGKISGDSRICFVDDGSSDNTWALIKSLSREHPLVRGIALSRNYGHRNALLCGLMEVMPSCNVAISLDCDGQDDVDAIDLMLERYREGFEVVYGVRSARKTDTLFKRTTADLFYRLMRKMSAETVSDHADYRLLGKSALEGLSQFGESNLFPRGLVPLIGFSSCTVEYERSERIAGDTHYPLSQDASYRN